MKIRLSENIAPQSKLVNLFRILLFCQGATHISQAGEATCNATIPSAAHSSLPCRLSNSRSLLLPQSAAEENIPENGRRREGRDTCRTRRTSRSNFKSPPPTVGNMIIVSKLGG